VAGIISGVSCGQYGFYEKFRFKLAGNRRLLCGIGIQKWNYQVLPDYRVKSSDFPKMTEMMKLWESKRGILGKSTLPAHFTDYMMATSPGTWVSSNSTFVSCDPDLLIRWLYDISPKKGDPKIQISTKISTDFSNFMVDKELYDKLCIQRPQRLFCFCTLR